MPIDVLPKIRSEWQVVKEVVKEVVTGGTFHYFRYPVYVFHSTIFFTFTSFLVLLTGTWLFTLGLDVDDGLYPYKSGRSYLERTLKYFGLAIITICFLVSLSSLVAMIGILRKSIYCLSFSIGCILCFMFFELFLVKSCSLVNRHTESASIEKVVDLVTAEYMDNLVFKSFYDDIQRHFECCGVGPGGFHDWARTYHRQCLRDSISDLRCTVPISCCNVTTLRRDPNSTACLGYVLVEGTIDMIQGVIYVEGCLNKLLWKYPNLFSAIGIAITELVCSVQFFLSLSSLVFIINFYFQDKFKTSAIELNIVK